MVAWAAECLESRALLSAIAVSSHAGVITLAGDSTDHSVGASVVNGNLELVGSNGTTFTFNGQTSDTVDVPLTGQLKALHITMQGGNNTINVEAQNLGTVSGNVVVNLGNGNNTFSLSDANVRGAVAIHGGNGGDTIQLSNDTAGSVAIHTGSGDDSVLLSSVTLTHTRGTNNSDLPPDSLGLGSTLVVSTGAGTDNVEIDSVSSNTKASDTWIISGSGTETVTMNSDTDHGSLLILESGSHNDSVTVNSSTVDKSTIISLPTGQEQITLSGDTFNGPVLLLTGRGNGSSISIDDSQFNSIASIVMFGSNATLNIETTSTVPGMGTEFHKSVFVSLIGPSAVASIGGNTVNNTVVFDNPVSIVGGHPAATVNITDANTTFRGRLLLISANRVDM